MPLNIVYCISSLDADGGGPARTVPELALAMARRGDAVRLQCVRGHCPLDPPAHPNLAVSMHASSWPHRGYYSRCLRDALRDGATPDIYHGSGLWEFPVHAMCAAARSQGRPYLISTRGTLERWALARSAAQKQLAALLYQRRDLRGAACLHALTAAEVASMRAYGLRNPVAVLPNWIDLEAYDPAQADRAAWQRRVPGIASRPYVLFLGRLHPKKGIPALLAAWAGVRREHGDWRLVVAGPDCPPCGDELKALASAQGLGEDVCFPGLVVGREKIAAIADAGIYVLPSHSEGFSLGVLEAISLGVPALITEGCHFPEVGLRNAGVVCAAEPSELRDGLLRLMALPPGERAAMGANGRRLAAEGYSRERIAAQMRLVYEWLSRGGTPPECVVFE
jgi:poly(glycerol-phosphate) alpha-glucosyltransferase